MILPALLLVFAFLQIGYQIATTGSFLNKGISLQGGLTVTIPLTDSDHVSIEQIILALKDSFPEHEINVRGLQSVTGEQIGLIVDADLTQREEIDRFVSTLEGMVPTPRNTFSIEEIGSALGGAFFKQTITSLLLAFLFIAVVVFLYFRVSVPCFAVILSAFSDIIVTLAIVNVLGVKVSTAGIAAFLMLIGYSIDTDMLLTIRVLKKKDQSLKSRVYSSIKTGLTMTFTAMGAVLAILLFSKATILTEIALIIFIGLIIDLVATWIQNVGLLRWYLERKGEIA